MRIAILNQNDVVVGFLDNEVLDALHYKDDELHTYLTGSAYTFTLTADSRHEDSDLLIVGHKLSFLFAGKGYYCNIVNVELTETEVRVEAHGLSLELINEDVDAYQASSAMSFAQYLKVFDHERVLTLGVNEVSDKRITNEWTGQESILARLFSLANVFDAELELVTELSSDYSLKQITLNVYRAHSVNNQGMGKDRRGEVLRYGVDFKSIRKISDVTELATMLHVRGRDDLTLVGLPERKVLNDAGLVEYIKPAGTSDLCAPLARDRFPSNLLSNQTDRYIAQVFEFDTDNVEMLYGRALARLKDVSQPRIKYEVEGYVEADIGDTFTIEDREYNPPLYLEARVTEQLISLTNPDQCATTFDNFVEVRAAIDPALLQRVNDLIKLNKTYRLEILSSEGVLFKDDGAHTVLLAIVRDGANEVTDQFTLSWYKDGVFAYKGNSINVYASDFVSKTVIKVEAVDETGRLRAIQEVTLARVSDGAPGPKGEPGQPGIVVKKTGQLDVFHLSELPSPPHFDATQIPSSPKPPSDIGEWRHETITPTDGAPYLWRVSVEYFSDDSVNVIDPMVIAIKGAKGPQGENGLGIRDVTTQYYLSDSTENQIGGTWQDTKPSLQAQKYLFMRQVITYSDLTKKIGDPIPDVDWNQLNAATVDYKNKIEDARQQIDVATQQTTESILAQVARNYYLKGDTDALLQSIRSNFEQRADSFEFNFQKVIQDLTSLNSDTGSKFAEINKYIRFVDGRIILGQVGNELELRLANDRIQFVQGGQEVAYFSNSKLYVMDQQTIHTLQIGHFAWVVNDDKSVSFKKVGGS